MPSNFLTDFPDRLSPMLVKELRQGMRARSFTLLFLIFQCLLALILLLAGSSYDSDGAGTFASGVIFTMFSIAVLVIQPMRGVNALSSEISGNTIEMMVLTRLTAWRIVFGKWIAIVSQSALILTTIIPYLILRYFFGGMVLVGELVFLCLIFLTSMALTAVMVGFSATSARLARVLPVIAVVFLANTLPSLVYRGGFIGGGGIGMSAFTLSSVDSQLLILGYLCLIGYLGWCALSYGTSSIAPVSENHSTLRRLIALGLTCIGVATGFHPEMDPYALTSIFAIILTPAIIVALTEPAILLPPIYQPFAKRGFIGRLASIILLPGWPAGVFFTALMIALSIGGIAISVHSQTSFRRYEPQGIVILLALLGGILLPATLSALFSKQETKRFTNFLLFLVVSILLTIVPIIVTGIINDKETFRWLFIWNPPVALGMLDDRDFNIDKVLTAIIVVDGLILAVLTATAWLGMIRYRKAFEQSEPVAAPAIPS